MHIILGKENADELRQRHTVLELETFILDDKTVTAYCVVTPESIVLSDMPDLERLCRLHQTCIDAFNDGNYDTALDAMQYVKGKFSGELDSFYNIIRNKIEGNNVNAN